MNLGTRSPKIAWDNGDQIQSIPDAIGVAMQRYLDEDSDTPAPASTSTQSETASQSDTTGQTDTDDSGDVGELIQNGESPSARTVVP